MIKAIAFDYTGVISAYGPIKKWMDNNLSKDDERYVLYEASTHKWDMGDMTLDEMYKALSKVTGTPPEKLWTTFFEKQILNKELTDFIKELKKDYKVYLFSNHHAGLLKKLLELHGISDLFEQIIVSSDHKLKKPDPEFFKVLLEIAEVEKDEIVFIDDLLENVDAGNKFGIKSILYKTVEQLKVDLNNLLTKQQ
jgi:HAD superfamily hydrolase (TIGR01549 family)